MACPNCQGNVKKVLCVSMVTICYHALFWLNSLVDNCPSLVSAGISCEEGAVTAKKEKAKITAEACE